MSVKLTVTVLFFLCAVAYSRTQTDLPDEDFTLSELPNPDPKATPVLLLPSQKPETEPATEIKYSVEVEIDEQTEPVPFRHRHRCRHGHRMMKPRFYGNDMIVSGEKDMIVSGEKDVDFELGDHQARRGVDRQVPARWTRFHHGGHRFSFYDDVANGEEREWGPKRHHHVEGEEEQEHGHEPEREHEHGHEHGGHRFSFYNDVANGEEREWGPKRHHEHHHVEGEEEQEHGLEHGHGPRARARART
ncbi:hypothetical protein OIU74_014448 [Salix koriyanagi]|uniref:Uncharacterized protein n=1 Tax=Salix koriyanagi TaxID=2511006 RepID=A0A9Q0PWC8_9ROSI|nr:hypothetical protein OIU74_014448 [Salix koriyanagi]